MQLRQPNRASTSVDQKAIPSQANQGQKKKYGFIKRFRDEEDGDAVIQFAMIAPIFFALLIGTIEICLSLFANGLLETSVDFTAREIRTGQIRADNPTPTGKNQDFCDNLFSIFDCDKAKLDLRPYSAYASLTGAAVRDAQGNVIATDFKFDPGGPGDIMLMRAYYEWPTYFNLMKVLAKLFNDDGTGGTPATKDVLQAAVGFRNEPFNGASGPAVGGGGGGGGT